MSKYLHLWYSYFDFLKPMIVVKLEFENVHILKACGFEIYSNANKARGLKLSRFRNLFKLGSFSGSLPSLHL